MHKNLAINVFDKSYSLIYGASSYMGEITIGSFKEKFVMPVSYWNRQRYEKQWEEGLKRLQNEEKSCLITSIRGSKKYPNCALAVEWWTIYRQGSQLLVYNKWLFPTTFKNIVRGPFNEETCYYFIPPNRHSAKDDESVWVINLG